MVSGSQAVKSGRTTSTGQPIYVAARTVRAQPATQGKSSITSQPTPQNSPQSRSNYVTGGISVRASGSENNKPIIAYRLGANGKRVEAQNLNATIAGFQQSKTSSALTPEAQQRYAELQQKQVISAPSPVRTKNVSQQPGNIQTKIGSALQTQYSLAATKPQITVTTNKQYPEYTLQKQKGFLTSFQLSTQLDILKTKQERESARGSFIAPALGVVYVGGKFVEGFYGVVRHPIKTFTGTWQTITHPIQSGKALASQLSTDPLGTIAVIGGQAAVGKVGSVVINKGFSTISKPKIEVTGLKSETIRLASDNLIVDATKQQAQIVVKPFTGKTKTYEVGGISAERFNKIGENVYQSKGTQAYKLSYPNKKSIDIKLSSVGETKVSETGSVGFRLIKTQSPNLKNNKYISLSKENFVTDKNGLQSSVGATEILSVGKSGRIYSSKTSSIGVSKSFELMRKEEISPTGTVVTSSKIQNVGLSTTYKNYINSLRNIKRDFKFTQKAKPKTTNTNLNANTQTFFETKNVKPVLSIKMESINIAKNIVAKESVLKLPTIKIKTLPYVQYQPIQTTKQTKTTKVSSITAQYKTSSLKQTYNKDVRIGNVNNIIPKFKTIYSTKNKQIIDVDMSNKQNILFDKTSITNIDYTSTPDIKITPVVTSLPSYPSKPYMELLTPIIPMKPFLPNFNQPNNNFVIPKSKPKKKTRQRKKLTPTLRAAALNIRGRTLKSSIISGLGERYIR